MDISLIYVDPNTRVVTLQLGTKTVKGLTKLVQIVVLSLLNTPGRDILDPMMGGGIPEMIGMNIDVSDLTEVASEFTRRVRKTEKEILNGQIGLDISPSEKLREIKIVDLGAGAAFDEIKATLQIINELGQQSDVVV